MLTLTVNGVNDAYARGVALLDQFGVPRSSRYGDVRVIPEPVTTHYVYPTQRVLFNEKRDANPFFHFFEALWMIDGGRDVALPAWFVKRMSTFSDNGVDFHGAYGWRWRNHFNASFPETDTAHVKLDQLEQAVQLLSANPDDRRVMVQMWDASSDLGVKSLDVPCNTMIKFFVSQDHRSLNMVVFNRSNDIIWGAYGANMTQFSMLQEYIASRVGISVGWYEQVSCDFHAYEEVRSRYVPAGDMRDLYALSEYDRGVITLPLMHCTETWDRECRAVLHCVRTAPHSIDERCMEVLHNPIFSRVAVPLANSYVSYKQNNISRAVSVLERAINNFGRIDWLVSGHEWMMRRLHHSSRGN